MFFRKAKLQVNDNVPVQSVPTVVARDTRIDGNLTSDGELHIDGMVFGTIQAQTCHVGPSGSVEGQIMADEVSVRGRVAGPIKAYHVHLQAGAIVDGDIYNQTIMIDSGAQLNGAVWRTETPLGETQVSAPARPLSDAAGSLFADSLWSARSNDEYRPLKAVRTLR